MPKDKLIEALFNLILKGYLSRKDAYEKAEAAKEEILKLAEEELQKRFNIKTKETKNSNNIYGCLEGDWQTECVIEILKILDKELTHAHICDVGDIVMRYVKENT